MIKLSNKVTNYKSNLAKNKFKELLKRRRNQIRKNNITGKAKFDEKLKKTILSEIKIELENSILQIKKNYSIFENILIIKNIFFKYINKLKSDLLEVIENKKIINLFINILSDYKKYSSDIIIEIIENFIVISENSLNLTKKISTEENLEILIQIIQNNDNLLIKKKIIYLLFNFLDFENKLIEIYIKMEILEILTKIIKDLYKDYEGENKTLSIYDNFSIFISCYFSILPFFKFSKMEEYILFIFEFYYEENKNVNFIEYEILRFLSVVSIEGENKDMEIFFNKKIWEKLIAQLIFNLDKDNMKKFFSLNILCNITSIENNKFSLFFLIFDSYEFLEKLENLLKNNDNFNLSNKLVLNLIKKDFLVKKIINQTEILTNLIKKFNKTTLNEIPEILILNTIFQIFKIKNNDLKKYILKTPRIIDLFIHKIQLDYSRKYLIDLGNVIIILIDLGFNNFNENVIINRIIESDKLKEILEKVLYHEDDEVYDLYSQIMENHFTVSEEEN